MDPKKESLLFPETSVGYAETEEEKKKKCCLPPGRNGPYRGTVGYELRTLHNLFYRYVHVRNTMEFGQFTSEIHFWVLGYLAEHKNQDVFQRDLETEFEVRRSTMTGILQTMEKNGWILRVSVNYDARLKKLLMTEKAKQIMDKRASDIANFEKRLITGISREELDDFFVTIDKIKKNLQEMQEQ